MDRLFRKKSPFLIFAFGILSVQTASSFELLSEGAMGSVSAISANTVEEIVSIAGPTAAGLRVDDDFESLPFQTSVRLEVDDVDEVSEELEFALTQEVEQWAGSVRSQTSALSLDPDAEVGYVDELPPSAFEDVVFLIRDDEFDSIIFEPNTSSPEESTIYELGRIEQTVMVLEQDVDSVEYLVERRVEFAATIDAYIGDPNTASVGSGYISDLRSSSSVRIATVRD